MNYASREERLLALWLDEMVTAGLVIDYYYEPFEILLTPEVSYRWNKRLKTKIKYFTSALLKPSHYTPDFAIVWNPIARGRFFKMKDNVGYDKECYFYADYWDSSMTKHSNISQDMSDDLTGELVSIIDVKPYFDYQNMSRLFTQNQKFVFNKFGLYVQKVVVSPRIGDLFPKTFSPLGSLLKKNGEPRKLKYRAQSLQQFLESEKTTDEKSN